MSFLNSVIEIFIKVDWPSILGLKGRLFLSCKEREVFISLTLQENVTLPIWLVLHAISALSHINPHIL